MPSRVRGVLVILIAVLGVAGLGLVGTGAGANRTAAADGRGRVIDTSLRSSALEGTLHFRVYLPAGYEKSGERYPVIYLLHGLPGDEHSYEGIDIRALGGIGERADRPAIVVVPQGARQGDTDPEWLDRGEGRDWSTAITKELMGAVDSRYRTIPDRTGRAIIGISAGGYGATIIAAQHPQLYSVVQSWSGYFHATNPEGSEPLDLGSAAANAEADVHAYIADGKRTYARWPIAFGFYIGASDPHFLPENEQLHRELLEAGIPHTYAMYPGGHTSAFWASEQDTWITTAVRQLARAHA